jgi:chemotaxis protein MotA
VRIREEQIVREMTVEGVVCILEGMNPRMLETRLLGFLSKDKERIKKNERSDNADSVERAEVARAGQ